MSIDLFSKPLFVGAHTDDIELFAGGTVARFAHLSFLVAFSQHAGKGNYLSPTEEAFEAAKCLGLHKSQIVIGTLPACQKPPESFFDHRVWIADTLREALAFHSPSIVITHQSTDTNQDHKFVHDEVKRVFKNIPIICGCFPANDIPAADRRLFVKLDYKQTRAKVEAVKAYESQRADHRQYLSEGNILHQLRFFGSLIGTEYAEAFEVVRLWV